MGIIDLLCGGSEEESENNCGDHYFKPWDETDTRHVNVVGNKYELRMYAVYDQGNYRIARQCGEAESIADKKYLCTTQYAILERECIHDGCEITEEYTSLDKVGVMSEDMEEHIGTYNDLNGALRTMEKLS